MLPTALIGCSAGGDVAVTPIPAPPYIVSDTPTDYSVHVSRSGARFVFAPLDHDSFEWWTPEQRKELTTYLWSVLIRGPADSALDVAARLPAIGFELEARAYAEQRPIPAGTQRGALAALLSAGTADVRQLEGHYAIPLRANVHAKAEGTRVVLEVRGRRTVARLFKIRPSHVTFYSYLPGEDLRVAHVPVSYADD